MPLDPCDPCSCVGGNISNESFKQKVLRALCTLTTPAATQDPEILCSPVDGRPIIAIFTAGGATTFLEIDGTTPYVGPAPVSCSSRDIEETETCLQITVAVAYGAVGDRVKLIRWFDTSVTPAVEIAQVFINETTGLAVVGVNATNSIPCDVTDTEVIEYAICDNGVTKIAQIIYTNGVATSVSYLALDRSVSAVPIDFNLVTYGACAVTNAEAPVIDSAPFLNASEISPVITLHTFNVPVKSVSVWNGGRDYVLADFITVSGTVNGNRQMIIPPGGSAQVGIDKDVPELIVEVELSTLGIVSGVTCPVIVNAAHPGRV